MSPGQQRPVPAHCSACPARPTIRLKASSPGRRVAGRQQGGVSVTCQGPRGRPRGWGQGCEPDGEVAPVVCRRRAGEGQQQVTHSGAINRGPLAAQCGAAATWGLGGDRAAAGAQAHALGVTVRMKGRCGRQGLPAGITCSVCGRRPGEGAAGERADAGCGAGLGVLRDPGAWDLTGGLRSGDPGSWILRSWGQDCGCLDPVGESGAQRGDGGPRDPAG